MINFHKIKLSCYALGRIVGLDSNEKLSKAEFVLLEKLLKKDILTEEEVEMIRILSSQKEVAEGTLSKTCKSYLREEVFIYHTYGRRIRPGGEALTESVTRIMKGSLAEDSAIKILSELDGINYHKNKRKFKNKWVSGIPDINHKKRLGDRKVIDIKASWDIYTFMNNLTKSLSKAYQYQTQGYISLTKADIGEVCFILVSAPEELIEKQVAKLKYKNVFASQEEYEEAASLTRMSMRFDDIPMEKRILRFPVLPNIDEQKMLFDRVDLCREWLSEYQRNHEIYFKND